MLLQDSQGRFPNLSKNRCRSNSSIPIVAWEYERYRFNQYPNATRVYASVD